MPDPGRVQVGVGVLVAEAALATRDFGRAREAMASLVADGARPTTRQCLMMADIEETEHGETGLLREWLARASRAPRDPTWVADGVGPCKAYGARSAGGGARYRDW